MKHAWVRVAALLAALLVPLTAFSAPRETISFWAVAGSVLDSRMYQRLAVDFEKKTGIRVNVTPLAWGSFKTKYFAAMAAGLPPDIGVTNNGGPFDYGSVGGVVDLRKEFPGEIEALEKQFPERLLHLMIVNGQLFGLPSDLSTMVMYYRTDTFAQLGIGPPKTWSELHAVLDKIEAAGYRYYFGFPAFAQWSIGLFTIPYGLPGKQMMPDGKPKVNYLNPKYLDGIFQAMRLAHTHDSPGKDMGSRAVGMFRSNEKGTALPLMFDIHSTFDNIRFNAKELQGKWDIAPWPTADDGKPYNIMGGTAYVIFRQSTKKKAAFEWLKYLNSLDVQRKMALDRMDRGDEASLFISPVSAMWGSENDAFWSGPAFQGSRRIIDVIRTSYQSFLTFTPINGGTEADRMEANLLDQLGTFIRDEMSALADRKGTSLTGVIQAFAAGKYPAEREALFAKMKARIKSGYEKIAEPAQTIIAKENERYERHYGQIIREMPRYERMSSALDVVKWSAVGLIGIALFTVGLRRSLRQHTSSYLFVALPVVSAVIFVFVPAVTALYLSFTEYHPVLPLSTASWEGANNYQKAVAGGDLTSAIGRTIYYALCTVPIGIVISLFFAYLLHNKPRGERLWRFLYFAPLVTSVVSIALIFTQLFLGGKQGWMNTLLMGVGAVRDPVQFLTSERSFLQCVIVLAIWHGLAFTILIFVAGLQQIPAQLFEAAEVDGAGSGRRFWNIALPGLRPQIFFISVLGVIGAFQVFEPIYMLANKSGDAGARFGPNDSAMTLVPLIYHKGFETYEMGLASAIAYVMFLIILAMTAFQFKVYWRKREDD